MTSVFFFFIRCYSNCTTCILYMTFIHTLSLSSAAFHQIFFIHNVHKKSYLLSWHQHSLPFAHFSLQSFITFFQFGTFMFKQRFALFILHLLQFSVLFFIFFIVKEIKNMLIFLCADKLDNNWVLN
jgi:hypothetical protein